MKKIIYLIILLILVNIVIAQDIQVVKESSQEINLNEIIEIQIHISNPSSIEKEFLIEEVLPNNIEVIEPTGTLIKKNDALEVEYYNWLTTVSPGLTKTLTYKIKPLTLGDYSIAPTKVTDNSNENTYSSNSISFKVNCIPNDKCDENENSLTCSEDCSTGISDGICSYELDSACDPDCDDDPDCKKSEFNMMYLIIPFIIILVIILLIWLIPKIFRKKEKFQIQEDPLKDI